MADEPSVPVAVTKKTAEERVNDLQVPDVHSLENVEEYVAGFPDYSQASAKVESEYKTTKLVQTNLMALRERIVESLPDLENNLNVLKVLKKRQEEEQAFSTMFMLADQVYTNATVEKVENVCLWLGAGIMAEFPIDEAIPFINDKIQELTTKAADLNEELAVIKKRLTTCEVNMANVYNFGVRKRQQIQSVQAK